MSERERIEDAMNQYARNQIALNAKVIAVEYHDDLNIWIGLSVSPAGSQRLVARKQADGTWVVSKHRGGLQTRPNS